jgi:HK97 family phage prohead protease
MPYYISDKQDDCSGWATVKIEDGAPVTIGCHSSKQDAVDQMVAVSLAEKIEPGGEYTRALPDYPIAEGDYVMGMTTEGPVVGLVEHIMSEGGVYGIEGSEYAIESTPENPAMAVRIFEMEDDVWEPTAYTIGMLMSDAKKVVLEEMMEEPDEDEEDVEEDRALATYKPTVGMKRAASRALRWKKEGKATGAGTPVGWGRATDIVAGRSISLSVVKRMYSFFSRHEVDKKGKDFYSTENPSNGRIMWDAWGGDAGFTWSASIVKRESGGQRMNMTDAQTRATNRAEKIVATLRKINGVKPASETRVSDVDFEIRADGEKMTFSGYAAVFNSDSQPLPFTERIAPGAFKRTLQARNDVKLLWNHDSGEVLASTRSGTMRLWEDTHGLRVEADLAPTTRGKDLSILMQRGDVNKMSFGFTVQKDSWSADGQTRTLESVRLAEVSIVTFPAYEESVAQVRSLDNVNVEKLTDALLALETEESLTPDQADLLTNVIKQMSKGEEKVEAPVEQVGEPSVIDLLLKKHELEGKML